MAASTPQIPPALELPLTVEIAGTSVRTLMAVSHCLTLFYLNSLDHIISIRANPLRLASTRTSAFSRPTTRKNYLRQKILKTLTKPYPFSVDPLVPIISPENLRLDGHEFERPSDQTPVELCPVTSGEVVKPEEFTGWETLESSANFTGTVPEGTVLRFGAYLIGVFVVQTVVAVWMMGNPNSDQKINSEGAEKMSRREFPVNRIGKVLPGNFDTKTENFVSIDDFAFEEKVEEIRALAGAVREAEKRQASEGVDIEDGNAISRPRYGIGKEIDSRLIKLQKRRTSSGEKVPDSHVNFLNKIREVEDGVGKDDSDVKEKKETLMFKKRHKFRSSSRELETSPKGFQGKESSISKKKKTDSSSIDQAVSNGNIVDDGSKRSKQANQGIAKAQDSASGIFGEGDGTNLMLQESLFPSDGGAKRLDKRLERISEPSNGGISTAKALKSSKTKELRTSPEGSPRTCKTSPKAAKPILSGNGAGDISAVPMVREKHSSSATGRWWLNLPYVLVIFIRRSSDHEGLGGLFTIKIPSLVQDKKNDSYTVGFEDRGDANNFCFLLESFFEDLGDFSADIVPLSRKELYESVASNTMKIVVAKKGQIQLYVGQPFADVEMALQALVEEDRNSSLDSR